MPYLPFPEGRFGRLNIVGSATTSDGHRAAECVCDCGARKTVRCSHLTSGAVKSCGCLNRELSAERNKIEKRTHGQTKTPEFRAWQGMWQRCTNPKDKSFSNYGGRGISVSIRWTEFSVFLADIGSRPSKEHSLDRIEVNGNYEPGNVRWATCSVQNRNKRTNIRISALGKTGVLADFFDGHSAEYQRARKLIKRGVDPELSVSIVSGR